MKVLFAVSNEEISASIVKKYQREYKEIISYKNVYYFNAILKELQKDKSYDRVVISEELEAFSNTQYSQIDKFIFDKLDNISDEATNLKGDDIPIIIIASDRREKSEEMLVKLFGIGIYDALIGNDRSVDNVCELLNKPRTKKEAKMYYKIESDDVMYQAEDENDVSEIEIQNILAHYKRLGKDENKYVESFDNIAAQYNDTQLRIISRFLPLNVRAVLEEKSEKYKSTISFGMKVSENLRKEQTIKNPGTSEKLLKLSSTPTRLTEKVVIPSAVDLNSKIKMALDQSEISQNIEEQKNSNNETDENVESINKLLDNIEKNNLNYNNEEDDNFDSEDTSVLPGFDNEKDEEISVLPEVSAEKYEEENILPGFIQENEIITESTYQEKDIETENNETDIKDVEIEGFNLNDVMLDEKPVAPSKRGRGRPRKYPIPDPNAPQKPKRGRGRPRKDSSNIEINDLQIEEYKNEINTNISQNVIENSEIHSQMYDEKKASTEFSSNEEVIPSVNFSNDEADVYLKSSFDDLNDSKEEKDTYTNSEEFTLPGLSETENDETILPGINKIDHEETEKQEINELYQNTQIYEQEKKLKDASEYYPDVDLTNDLTEDKKIVCFVGTSKNGTSFIVNNIAQITSANGIDTAIIDTTQNRNSYYIYTQNDENLRKIAMGSINNLENGNASGIQVNKNLTVYTSLPEESEGIGNAGVILQTLLKKHKLILIDCDFDTPIRYFAKAQEIYLVQTLDILTIQPLTAFLKELKSKNLLNQNKIRIVLNKTVNLRGINDKVIIGGMAYYNDPSMSYMTELFDKNTVRYLTIPFNEEVYAKYLESIVNCEVTTKGYPKDILQSLNALSRVVYPVVTQSKQTYNPPSVENNSTFSASINSTLDQMKRKY